MNLPPGDPVEEFRNDDAPAGGEYNQPPSPRASAFTPISLVLVVVLSLATLNDSDPTYRLQAAPILGYWGVLVLLAWPLLRYAARQPDRTWLGGGGAFAVWAVGVFFMCGSGLTFLIISLYTMVRVGVVLLHGNNATSRILALFFALAFLLTGVVEGLNELGRDEVDRLLLAPTRPSAGARIKELERNHDLPSLRRLLEGPEVLSWRAAESLGRVGMPAVDGPLLVARLRDAEKRSANRRDDYSAALETLLKAKPAAAKPTAADWAKLLPTPTPAAPSLTGASAGT